MSKGDDNIMIGALLLLGVGYVIYKKSKPALVPPVVVPGNNIQALPPVVAPPVVNTLIDDLINQIVDIFTPPVTTPVNPPAQIAVGEPVYTPPVVTPPLAIDIIDQTPQLTSPNAPPICDYIYMTNDGSGAIANSSTGILIDDGVTVQPLPLGAGDPVITPVYDAPPQTVVDPFSQGYQGAFDDTVCNYDQEVDDLSYRSYYYATL